MLKNSFIDNIYCQELKTNIKGFLSSDQITILRENSYTGYILQGMEYRPDKVAAYYLGDERLGWAITAASGFENGIEDYYEGRKITIPNDTAFTKLSNG